MARPKKRSTKNSALKQGLPGMMVDTYTPVKEPASDPERTPGRGPLLPPEKMKSSSREESTATRERPAVSTGSKATAVMPTAGNDPEWYARDSRLLMDAANIPFSQPFGATLDFFEGASNIPGGVTLASNLGVYPVAGITTLQVKPSGGRSDNKSSPLNVCANALYTHVRYINSGRKNYDPADLMIYTLAFGDIYGFVNWCIRIYHYAFMYSQRNWYIGRDLLLANKIDADALIANLANFRYWINSIVNKISSFCVPGDIYYFKRRVFMFSGYYVENGFGNIKDQLYQFAPEGFYAFSFDSNKAGKLAYNKLPNGNAYGLLEIGHLQAYFENVLMANITGDEDFGLMSGDILKAYGDNIIHIAQIPEEGGLMPIHDPYVLSQFKNAQRFGVYRADASKVYKDKNQDPHVYGDIEQTTDGLLVSSEGLDWTTAVGKRNATLAAMKKIITVENPNPNVGDVIEATRLLPYLGYYPDNDGTSNYHYDINGGTEFVVEISISTGPATSGHDTSNIITVAQVRAPSQLNTSAVSNLSQFKYGPLGYIADIDNSDVLQEFRVIGNLDNTTFVDNNILKRLHEVALLSLFYVPGVAKIIS